MNILKIFYNKIINKYRNLKKYYSKLLLRLLSKYINLLPSSIKGHFNFIYKYHFYNIITSNQIYFFEEYNNIKFIKRKYKEIFMYIPHYFVINFFNLLIFQRSIILENINNKNELFSIAGQFLDIFRKYGIISNIRIYEMPYITTGLSVLKHYNNNLQIEKIYNDIDSYLTNNNFHIGFCHGDFHAKNIMKSGNKMRIIDLDCIREYSIQEFDAIYFIIQEISEEHNNSYLNSLEEKKYIINNNHLYRQFLENYINYSNFEKLFFIYILDRIGQDFKYYKYSFINKETINNIIIYYNKIFKKPQNPLS